MCTICFRNKCLLKHKVKLSSNVQFENASRKDDEAIDDEAILANITYIFTRRWAEILRLGLNNAVTQGFDDGVIQGFQRGFGRGFTGGFTGGFNNGGFSGGAQGFNSGGCSGF